MTEPEDGAGLPSLLASPDVGGLVASALAVVEREAGWLVNSDYPTLRWTPATIGPTIPP